MLSEGVPLKGIVQIYFLLDIEHAIYSYKEDRDYRKSKKILQYDIESLRPPIFLGIYPELIILKSPNNLVEAFFNRTIELGTKYLNKDC